MIPRGAASRGWFLGLVLATVWLMPLHAQVPDLETGLPQEMDLDFNGEDFDAAADTVRRFRVYPLRMHPTPTSRLIETDSTLRWNQWLEWSEKLSRQPGVITYRLGGFNRTDFVLIDGLGLTDQRLVVEGMHTHNAVTGLAMYPHLSLERLSEAYTDDLGLTRRTDVEFQRMYLRRPRTRVRYEQSAFELRSTEVQLAQMVSRQLGVELMYHGKNDEGEYLRSATESRQMSARMWYHLSPRYVAQTMIIYNGIQLEESGGYAIQNLAGFNFNRFFANPVRPGASSSVRHSQVQLALMRRETAEADTLQSRRADTRLIMYYDRYRRSYTDAAVFTSFRYQGAHITAQHARDAGWISARGEVRGSTYYLIPSQNPSLSIDSWSLVQAEVRSLVQPPVLSSLQLRFPVVLRTEHRSDSMHEWELTLGAAVTPLPVLTLHGAVSSGQKAPTIQQRYWEGQIRGNTDLQETFQQRYTAGVRLHPTRGDMTLDVTGFWHEYQDMTVLRADSSFGRIASIDQWGARVAADWHHPSWEVHLSSTLQQYRSDNLSIEAQLLTGSGLRIWNRASVHWKGYVLDNAAFVKTGFYGVLSGNPYRPAAYFPAADLWDGSQNVPEIPGFVRVDADLTARVRAFMFMLRWENITQGLVQNGYYESAVYPMPSRRLRFGLRVYFTN